MPSEAVEVLVIACLILFNGFLSMSEMSVVSSRKSKLKQKADEGKRGFILALKIADSPGQFLSTIQTGISLIGILSGAFGGATIANSLSEHLMTIPFLAPYAQIMSIGIVVLAITFTSIVIGELVPKRLALSHPEGIASVVVFPVKLLSLIFLPIVRLLTVTTEFILKILRIKKADEPPVSVDEIAVLMEQGKSYGLFHEREQEMVERVLWLKKTKPFSFMTPRLDIAYFDLSGADEELVEMVLGDDRDFIPVCRGSMDELVGVINVRRALRLLAAEGKTGIRNCIEEPLYLPQSMNALAILEKFKNSRTTCAFIIDEYGGVLGMADLDDVLEEIVGSVTQDENTPTVTKRHDGTWFVDGLLPITDFYARFELKEKAIESSYHTVAGLVLHVLDKIPQEGDLCRFGPLELEVADMDSNRIDKIIVRKMEETLADKMD